MWRRRFGIDAARRAGHGSPVPPTGPRGILHRPCSRSSAAVPAAHAARSPGRSAPLVPPIVFVASSDLLAMRAVAGRQTEGRAWSALLPLLDRRGGSVAAP